mgnify:FL=1
MRKLLLLLGTIWIFVLSCCGKSDGIEGSWIPKIHFDNIRIESIIFSKQNDFSYKGVITYSDGKQVTSTFKYDKQYNEVGEEPADALKKEKEFKIHGRVFMQFNEKYTEATFNNDSRPENIFVKK